MNNDEHLVKAIQMGDEEAFESLFFKYYEALSRFAYQYVDSMAIAEGFVQDVFEVIWKKHHHLRSIDNIRSYLYRAVKNKAMDHLKHQNVVQKYEQQVEFEMYGDVYSNNNKRITREGFIEAARNAIEELPEHTRHIYKMSRKDGLTYREISQVLDISVKTVESHMSKALRILRKRLAGYLPALIIACLLCELAA